VYLRIEDGVLGYKDENGTWRGVVGALVTKRAEVAFSPLAMSNERLDAIDFLPPILNDR
jgi:ionotropic glutamate receptor NMDA 3A